MTAELFFDPDVFSTSTEVLMKHWDDEICRSHHITINNILSSYDWHCDFK